MTISRRTILTLNSYPDENEWTTFYRLSTLGEIVKKRFKTGYVLCKAENMGWQRVSAHKVFECDFNTSDYNIGRDFLSSFCPKADYSARVYSLNGGRGLYFNVTYHDNPVNGDSYYLTPICEKTFDRLSA